MDCKTIVKPQNLKLNIGIPPEANQHDVDPGEVAQLSVYWLCVEIEPSFGEKTPKEADGAPNNKRTGQGDGDCSLLVMNKREQKPTKYMDIEGMPRPKVVLKHTGLKLKHALPPFSS